MILFKDSYYDHYDCIARRDQARVKEWILEKLNNEHPGVHWCLESKKTLTVLQKVNHYSNGLIIIVKCDDLTPAEETWYRLKFL